MDAKIIPISSSETPFRFDQQSPGASITRPIFCDEETLAAHLMVSTRHLRVLRSRRAIPYVKLGRAVRYRLADVERAIDEQLTIRPRTSAAQ